MHSTWFLRCPQAWKRRWSPTQRTWKPKSDKICHRSRILERKVEICSIWMRFKSSKNTASSWMTYFQLSHPLVGAIFKIPALSVSYWERRTGVASGCWRAGWSRRLHCCYSCTLPVRELAAVGQQRYIGFLVNRYHILAIESKLKLL